MVKKKERGLRRYHFAETRAKIRGNTWYCNFALSPPGISNPSPPAMSTSNARKPCDQCHKRKVRCDYGSPCNRCRLSGLECSYSIIRQKRGPRKGKGKILNRLRAETQDPLSDSSAANPVDVPPNLDASSAGLQNTDPVAGAGLADEDLMNILSYDDSWFSFDDFTRNVLVESSFMPHEGDALDDPLSANTPFVSTSTPGGLSTLETPQTAFATTIALPTAPAQFEVTPIIERSVQLWFEHQYPTYPLLSQDRVYSWLQNPDHLSIPQQTVVWAMASMSLLMIDKWPDLGQEQRTVASRQFIRKCRQLRLESDYLENPAFEDVLTSLFIANTYFDLKCRKTSWTFNRQAITLASAANLHRDEGYSTLEEEESIRRRRAYVLLYITERGAAMLDGFPVSILAPPNLPAAIVAGESSSIVAGLAALHALFSLLDMKFVKLWNDPSHVLFDNDVFADLSALQAHLSAMQFDEAKLTDIQKADVLITREWLKLVFWQTALKLGYISTAAADPAFTYNYPVEIAMALCSVVKNLPPMAIQVHGLGIFEKQFEIAYSLMDTLALSGPARPEHHECLRYLLLSLSASPSSRQVYVHTLEKKMDSQQKYRNLAGVELLRDDARASRQNSRRQSIVPGANRRTS